MSSQRLKYKGRSVDEREVQTEAAFNPFSSDPLSKFSDVGSRQFEDLKQLRDTIKIALTELGGTTYDLLAYKDIVMSMAPNLPELPVTDLLLLSSKLFRRTGELGRLLGGFFNVVFAEDFADENFHFVELRIAKRDIADLQQRVDRLTAEKHALQELYEELGKGSLDHAKTVEVLETRNDILELRSSALEDQMALLFHQLTDEFRHQNSLLLHQAVEDIEVQEHLSATRTAFTQSVDAVQSRVKFFQSLLLELQDDPVVQQDSGFRNKVKSLDVHVQHILNRFTAVKEGLLSTASELMQALHDKRKALNFSVAHLKVFDIQNTKLRQARATLHELRQRITEVERMLQHSFPHGGITRVDRNGDVSAVAAHFAGGSNSAGTTAALLPQIADSPLLPPSASKAVTGSSPPVPPVHTTSSHVSSSTSPTGVASTATFSEDAANSLRRSKFCVPNVKHVTEQVQLLNDVVVRLTAYLDTEEEQKSLLRTLTLSVPTTGRTDAGKEKAAQAQLSNKNFLPSAQAAPLLMDTQRGTLLPMIGSAPGASSGAPMQPTLRSNSVVFAAAAIAGGSGRSQSISLGAAGGGAGAFSGTFVPTSNSSSQLMLGGSAGGGGLGAAIFSAAAVPEALVSDPQAMAALRDDFVTKLNFLRDVYEERIADLEARNDRLTKRLTATQLELKILQKDEARKVDIADREAVLKAKEAWMGSREEIASESQSVRQSALQLANALVLGKVSVSDIGGDGGGGDGDGAEGGSPKNKRPNSGGSTSGMQHFISPQAKLLFLRQNIEKKEERPPVTLYTATPALKSGPVMRTEASVAKQQRNEQLIRAMRRLTGVKEFRPPAPTTVGKSVPPPLTRRLSMKPTDAREGAGDP